MTKNPNPPAPDTLQKSEHRSQRVLLCLYNMGGPSTLDQVEPFLLELFGDNDLISVPFPSVLQKFVAEKIARKRTPDIQSKYAEIGGGSPQLAITQNLGVRLEEELKGQLPAGFDLVGVVPLMRYTSPRAQEILARVQSENVDEVWLLPQYPHCSRATTGTSLREIALLLRKQACASQLTVRTFSRYGDDPAFHAIWAERLAPEWQSLKPGRRHLIVSAHNLPVSYVAQGDPYRTQIYETARQTLRRLGLTEGLDWTLAWQSAVGPVRWMQPDTRDVIRNCAKMGVSDLLIWPIAFVSDHIETLHEIDIEFAEIAHKEGISEFRRVQNLNVSDPFVSYLKGMVTTAAQELATKGQTLRLRAIDRHPSGEGCHWQTGGCLCGRYYKSGQDGKVRGTRTQKLPPTLLQPGGPEAKPTTGDH
jgi:ferrochelatase